MTEEENDEKRLSVEFLRLITFFADYLDKSTLATAFMFLGMVLIGLAPLLYYAGFLDIVAVIVLAVNGGFTIVYASYFYRRMTKRRLNRYVEAASRKTLMSDSEYRGYLANLERMLEDKYKELTLAEKEEVELRSLRNQVVHLQEQNESLARKLKQLESRKEESL